MIVITDDELYLETCYDETIFKLSYNYNRNIKTDAIIANFILSLNSLPKYNIIVRDFMTYDGIMYNSIYLNIKPFPFNVTKKRCTNRINLRNTEVNIYSNTGRVCIDDFEVNYIFFNPLYSKDYVRFSSKRLIDKLIRDTYNISNCSYTHDSR